MSRNFFRWIALLVLGLCALPTYAAKHYISRSMTGQYYAFDPTVKRWLAISDPEEYVRKLYRQKRPEGFGGEIAYKDWVKPPAPAPVQAANSAAALTVGTVDAAAARTVERLPVVRRVTEPTRGFLFRKLNPPPR